MDNVVHVTFLVLTRALLVWQFMVRQAVIAQDAFLIKGARLHQDLTQALAQELIPNGIDHSPGVGETPAHRALVKINWHATNTYKPIGKPVLIVSSKSCLSWESALNMWNLTGNNGDATLNSDLGQGQKLFAMSHGSDVHVEVIAFNNNTGEGVYVLWRKFTANANAVTRGLVAKNDHESITLKFYAKGTDENPVVNWFNAEGDTRLASDSDKIERGILLENTAFAVYNGTVFDEVATASKMKEMIWEHAVKPARTENRKITHTNGSEIDVVNTNCAVTQIYTGLKTVTTSGNQMRDECYRNEPNGDITCRESGKKLSYWIARYWQPFPGLKRPCDLSSGGKVHWFYDIEINGVDVKDLIIRDRVADNICKTVMDCARLRDPNPKRTVVYQANLDRDKLVKMFVALHPRCFDGMSGSREFPNHSNEHTGYVNKEQLGTLDSGGVCFHINRFLNYGNPNALLDGNLSIDSNGKFKFLGKPSAIYQLKPWMMRECVVEIARLCGCEVEGTGLTTDGKNRFKTIVKGGTDTLLTLLTPSTFNPNGMQPDHDRRALHKISLTDTCYILFGGNLAPNNNKTGYSTAADGRASLRAFSFASLLSHTCRLDPFMGYHLELVNQKTTPALITLLTGPSP